MNFIEKVTGFLKDTANTKKLDSLKALNQDPNPMVVNISKALGDVVINHFSSDEKAMIYKIENLRTKLNASKDTINVIDYGAGSSTDQRSEKEMYNLCHENNLNYCMGC